MYLVAIAWMYVVVMMAAAEATNANGTLLGALVTFVLYGVLPLTIVMYLLGTPARRQARRRAEARERAASVGESAAATADGRDHAPGDGVAPVREEP